MRWNNIEEIAESLEDNYPDEDLLDVKLLDIEEMVMSLSDFEDHDVKVNKDTLNEILEAWLDLRQGD